MLNDNGKRSEVIFAYTQAQAIEDGVLVHVGYCGNQKVIFTSNLFAEGYEDAEKRRVLVLKGLEMLAKPDPEDAPEMKLRVIEKEKIWLIWNPEGFTFMRPEDY